MRKTGGGEERNLLATGNGVHDIDSGDTGLNHFLRISTSVGVNGLTIDIEIVFGKNGRSVVDSNTRTVESTTQHFFRTKMIQRKELPT